MHQTLSLRIKQAPVISIYGEGARGVTRGSHNRLPAEKPARGGRTQDVVAFDECAAFFTTVRHVIGIGGDIECLADCEPRAAENSELAVDRLGQIDASSDDQVRVIAVVTMDAESFVAVGKT